jgi:hypothetical protein
MGCQKKKTFLFFYLQGMDYPSPEKEGPKLQLLLLAISY